MAPLCVIENWSVTTISNDPYSPPERCSKCLQGNIYNHPTVSSDRIAHTSQIVSVDGLYVTTRSRVYLLGKPDPNYLIWCKDNGINFDPNYPIKLRSI
jgi:hypothetical protein